MSTSIRILISLLGIVTTKVIGAREKDYFT